MKSNFERGEPGLILMDLQEDGESLATDRQTAERGEWKVQI